MTIRPKAITSRRHIDQYIGVTGIAADKDGAMFRTTGRSTGTTHRMAQSDAYRMIERRARQAGIKTKISNHSLRDRNHRLPEKRRLVGGSAQDGEPC
jgi:hypothetical protein